MEIKSSLVHQLALIFHTYDSPFTLVTFKDEHILLEKLPNLPIHTR